MRGPACYETFPNRFCVFLFIVTLAINLDLSFIAAGQENQPASSKPKLAGARPVIYAINYASIQEAIDAVADGGTIHIAAGTYSGLISLNKSVNLLGANAGIDPNGHRPSSRKYHQP